MALQLGELAAIVGALHFHGVLRLRGGHRQAVGHRHGDHVGQVVLALGVAVGQPAHPLGHARAGHGEDAGVALADRALLGGRVLLLDDGADLPLGVANDPAIAGGIGQLHGEQGQLRRAGVGQQALEGRRLDQRHVAVQHQHLLGTDERQRLGDRVAGAELLLLEDEIQVVGRQALAHRFGAVADDHMDALRLQRPGGVDDMAEHGLAGDRMQDLGQRRAHAGALTGGEDDDFQTHWCTSLCSPSAGLERNGHE
ncbi:hypothetical protein D3C81_857720 [compost metagenome]